MIEKITSQRDFDRAWNKGRCDGVLPPSPELTLKIATLLKSALQGDQQYQVHLYGDQLQEARNVFAFAANILWIELLSSADPYEPKRLGLIQDFAKLSRARRSYDYGPSEVRLVFTANDFNKAFNRARSPS